MVSNYYYPSQAITVHRDQDQPRPLYGALEHGCKYIEFDVHLVENGDLLVGHDAGVREKTIESVYLNPLLELNQAGSLGGEFSLLIDIKTKANETFIALHKVLKKYSSMLTTYEKATGLTTRAVRVIITGNRNKDFIKGFEPRLAFYDGRVIDGDLSDSLDPNFMPIVSSKWFYILKPTMGYWPFVLQPPRYLPTALTAILPTAFTTGYDNAVKEIIKANITIIAQKGIAFRLWAMPEEEHTWRLLADFRKEGFVYNTDYPDRLIKFFNGVLKQEPSEENLSFPQILAHLEEA